MRKIETQILDAIVNKKYLSTGKPINFYSSWKRDTVQYNKFTNAMDYFLHGTLVASIYDDKISLGVFNGAWCTVTTKTRINAIARHYNIAGICQKKHVWYWSDGLLYNDNRIFMLERV